MGHASRKTSRPFQHSDWRAFALSLPMTLPDLQELLLKNTATLAELQTQVSQLVSKEQRVGLELSVLRTKLEAWLLSFHRDKYKSTDQRLFVHALAEEILIFVKLGYDV